MNISIPRPTSFFDDQHLPKEPYSIWKKPSSTHADVKSITQRIIGSNFIKKTKKSGKSKTNYFVLDENFLYKIKSEKDTKIAGTLDLTCVRLDLLHSYDPKLVESTISQPIHGFRLWRNGKILEIFTKDNSLFKQWKNILIMRCIQSTFHEEFTVTKMIGKGSFAKVYLATKKENSQPFAIKAFNKEFMATQPKGKESLVNEIAMMRLIKSDYSLNLYQVYETTNSIYFVVDLLQGGELLNRVRDKGSYTQKDLRVLMIHLLSALAVMHSKNIMHRDLKPENILLQKKESDSDIVIADFGLATKVHDPDMLFQRCGTPGFVAPEVLSYKDGDPIYGTKCDVFSAGVIFYLLLTGKQPFQGKDYKIILRANKACEISFSGPQFGSVDNDTMKLLKKMLDANPSSRPTAEQCLKQSYFHLSDEELNKSVGSENLKVYEVHYVQGLRNKNQEELVGSLQLHSGGNIAMNGRTDTIGSMTNGSFAGLESKDVPKPQESKFQNTRSDSLKEEEDKTDDSPRSGGIKKKSNNNNLMKNVLQNNAYAMRSNQEKQKDDSDQDVEDENSNVAKQIQKLDSPSNQKGGAGGSSFSNALKK